MTKHLDGGIRGCKFSKLSKKYISSKFYPICKRCLIFKRYQLLLSNALNFFVLIHSAFSGKFGYQTPPSMTIETVVSVISSCT